MKRRLIPKAIDALPPAANKRYELHDQLLPGLHMRVSATGGKVFYSSTRINGRMKPIKNGTWPILTLHEARDKARSILRSIELGRYTEKVPRDEEQCMMTLIVVVAAGGAALTPVRRSAARRSHPFRRRRSA